MSRLIFIKQGLVCLVKVAMGVVGKFLIVKISMRVYVCFACNIGFAFVDYYKQRVCMVR